MLARLPLGIYHIAIVEEVGGSVKFYATLRALYLCEGFTSQDKKDIHCGFKCTDFFVLGLISVVHIVTHSVSLTLRDVNLKNGETHSTSFAWVGSLKESIPRFHAPFPPPSEQHRREEERRRRNARRTH